MKPTLGINDGWTDEEIDGRIEREGRTESRYDWRGGEVVEMG